MYAVCSRLQCDFGSLHSAIQKGLLHGVTAAGVTVVNMRRLLLVSAGSAQHATTCAAALQSTYAVFVSSSSCVSCCMMIHAVGMGSYHHLIYTLLCLCLLVQVLLDIARSLQHIHAQSLIHCDLKPANVLLKSGTDSPLGFVCKLAGKCGCLHCGACCAVHCYALGRGTHAQLKPASIPVVGDKTVS